MFEYNHSCYDFCIKSSSILENYKKGLPISRFYGNTIANEKGGPFYESYYEAGEGFAQNYHTP